MTLKDLDDAGKDVRAWCFDCARGDRIDAIIWKLFADRGWPMGLADAAPRFRCRQCGSAAAVHLYPATRPYLPPMTATDMAALIFFGARKAAKSSRRDPIIEAAWRTLSAPARQSAQPRPPRPAPPPLRLAWPRPDRPDPESV
ncbi:MAG: hypothetical protein DI569_15095 [Sphingopyxis macrogoltabida]|uniref:Uncharacterized protein n=1 Tax=Sphingopyxis macrogoltabida TaxID=33050 RepID=A0A2W5KYZ4_SPHMC|nr:MAG: hypothetical protein DI569_15095 [Sphingopyxis macrogoltabida]